MEGWRDGEMEGGRDSVVANSFREIGVIRGLFFFKIRVNPLNPSNPRSIKSC